MSFYNVHTHIFNAASVPDAFLTNYRVPLWIAKLLRVVARKYALRKAVLFVMKYIPLKLSNIQFKRYAALLDIAMHKSQGEVFTDLMSNYYPDARMAVLTMNFDYMTGDMPESNYNNYETQLYEVLQERKIRQQNILPFLFVDPRQGADKTIEMVKYYFDLNRKRGMVGIKLYPALGYYPFHPNLEKVYEYAQAYGIPITTHCYKGGGAYYTGKFSPAMMSYHSFNPSPASAAFLDERLKDFDTGKPARFFSDTFLHPILFEDVLLKFPKLKINFAHLGGDEDILEAGRGKPDNWTDIILKYIVHYPNVYGDVSYTMSYPLVNDHIADLMQTPAYHERLLFGTDYFLVSTRGKDIDLNRAFLDKMGKYGTVLTETNPKLFLSSPFFS